MELESCYTTLVLGSQWLSEEIWGNIKIYAFLCSWNFLVAICILLLSIGFHFSCRFIVTRRNGSNMCGLGLGDILLVITVNHTGESYKVSSGGFPRLFLHLGLKFTSDREYFLVKMYILLSLVLFGPCRRGVKVGNKRNNKSLDTIFCEVPHQGSCFNGCRVQ